MCDVTCTRVRTAHACARHVTCTCTVPPCSAGASRVAVSMAWISVSVLPFVSGTHVHTYTPLAAAMAAKTANVATPTSRSSTRNAMSVAAPDRNSSAVATDAAGDFALMEKSSETSTQ
eukprot:357208-Chlamydomonas_euryale.AAC.6